HGYRAQNSKEGPQGGTISLETPVLYFYPKHDLTASAQVEFPKGTITEWYPQAGREDKKLTWQGIKLLTGENVRLLSEVKGSRYYAARETDAAPVRATAKHDGITKTEQEKFLFYRGVGTFDMPLSVRALDDKKFAITWKGQGLGGDLLLIRVQSG